MPCLLLYRGILVGNPPHDRVAGRRGLKETGSGLVWPCKRRRSCPGEIEARTVQLAVEIPDTLSSLECAGNRRVGPGKLNDRKRSKRRVPFAADVACPSRAESCCNGYGERDTAEPFQVITSTVGNAHCPPPTT